MAFRKANVETFKKKYGVKLSFMSPFLKAAANALEDQPVVNSVIIDNNIVYRLVIKSFKNTRVKKGTDILCLHCF